MKYEEVIAEQMKQRQAVYYGNQYKKVDSGSNGHKSKIEDVPTTKRKELAKIAGTSEGSIQRSKLSAVRISYSTTADGIRHLCT